MTPNSGPTPPTLSSLRLSNLLIFLKNIIESDFLKKFAETFSTRIILIIISLATGVIITRTLGPEGRGIYAIAIAIGALGVQFCNLGLHSSNTFYISRDPSYLSPLLGNSLIVSFVIGTLTGLIAWIVFILFPEIAPISGAILILSLVWIPLNLAYVFLQNLLVGLQDIRSYNNIELRAKVFGMFGLGVIIYFELISPISVFIVALLTLPLSIHFAYRKLIKLLTHKPSPSFSMFKKSLPYGLKSFIGSLLGFLLLKIDLIMVNDMIGKKEAGFYDVAANMAEVFYTFPSIVFLILFPKLCAIESMNEKWVLAKKVGLALMISLVLVSFVTTFLADFIIQLLFGHAFIPSTQIFVILILGKVVLAAASIFGNFIASIHVPITLIYCSAGLVVLNIFLNWILIGMHGMAGAAFSSIICFSFLVLFNMYYSFKFLRHPKPSIA
jgi:O-antigen/teichoic acid export membrane protein